MARILKFLSRSNGELLEVNRLAYFRTCVSALFAAHTAMDNRAPIYQGLNLRLYLPFQQCVLPVETVNVVVHISNIIAFHHLSLINFQVEGGLFLSKL